MQARSRKKVEALLDAAERIVVERGVEAVSTRDIADAAQVPVASLYQYFADKEAVFLALAERHMAEMDEQTLVDLAESRAQGPLSVGSLVETSMRAFIKVYLRRPAFVEIYLRGRTNPALHAYGRDHNRRIAATLHEVAIEEGLAGPDLPEAAALLAVELGDRVFQLAFERDDDGDAAVIEEGIALLTSYLERYEIAPAATAGVSVGTPA
ncbi:TetR/AcrR family transcriptional regulator [Nocardioides sp.]|uniref:TetR/AcrR family transcriptional regulator n=1 Tax=Nocardioides sp. TaxID=35761 RepID=UPI002B26D502|nr:TetR/AcrR family transcriptional regulator [Nocardioides sp.]